MLRFVKGLIAKAIGAPPVEEPSLARGITDTSIVYLRYLERMHQLISSFSKSFNNGRKEEAYQSLKRHFQTTAYNDEDVRQFHRVVDSLDPTPKQIAMPILDLLVKIRSGKVR